MFGGHALLLGERAIRAFALVCIHASVLVSCQEVEIIAHQPRDAGNLPDGSTPEASYAELAAPSGPMSEECLACASSTDCAVEKAECDSDSACIACQKNVAAQGCEFNRPRTALLDCLCTPSMCRANCGLACPHLVEGKSNGPPINEAKCLNCIVDRCQEEVNACLTDADCFRCAQSPTTECYENTPKIGRIDECVCQRPRTCAVECLCNR